MGTLNVGFDHLTTSNRFYMFVLLRRHNEKANDASHENIYERRARGKLLPRQLIDDEMDKIVYRCTMSYRWVMHTMSTRNEWIPNSRRVEMKMVEEDSEEASSWADFQWFPSRDVCRPEKDRG